MAAESVRAFLTFRHPHLPTLIGGCPPWVAQVDLMSAKTRGCGRGASQRNIARYGQATAMEKLCTRPEGRTPFRGCLVYFKAW